MRHEVTREHLKSLNSGVATPTISSSGASAGSVRIPAGCGIEASFARPYKGAVASVRELRYRALMPETLAARWIVGRRVWNDRYSSCDAERHLSISTTQGADRTTDVGLLQKLNAQATFTVDRCALRVSDGVSVWLPPARIDFAERTLRLVEEQSRSWRGLSLDEAIEVVSRAPCERDWAWAPITIQLCRGADKRGAHAHMVGKALSDALQSANCWCSIARLDDLGLVDAVFDRYFGAVPPSTIGRGYARARADGPGFGSCSDDARSWLMWACLLSPDPALLLTADRVKKVGGAVERGLTRLGFAPVFAFRVRAIVSIAAEQRLDIGSGMPCDRAFLRSIERYGRWKADLAATLTRFAIEPTAHLRTDEAAAMPCEARRGGPR